MKTKPMKMKRPKWKALPNEAHRAEKWSGGHIQESKKVYRRTRKKEINEGERK